MDYGNIVGGIVKIIKKAETELPSDVIIALKNAYDIEEGIAKTQWDIYILHWWSRSACRRLHTRSSGSLLA